MALAKATRQSLLKWQRGHQVASERSWALRAAARPSPEESFARANSLLGLMGDVITSSFNEETRRKETKAARERWIALKQKFAARGA
jgi:hypothetical protein